MHAPLRCSRWHGAVLVLALGVSACGPASFDVHRADYERLVLLRLQDRDAPLWLTSTAPEEARRLMLRLGIDAVLSDERAGWVHLRHGGGYAPESGYLFLLDRADTSAVYRQQEGLYALGDGWHAYGL